MLSQSIPWTTFLLSCASIWLAVQSIPAPQSSSYPTTPAKHNDFSCRSKTQPNPVVLLHGLGATYYEDLNVLESYLQSQGFCTFSLTYGAFPGWPYVGGLQHINESAVEISAFVQQVRAQTQASSIDLVGHSEGAFQTLYVPKVEGLSSYIDKIVAIAPPTHGTTFAGLYNIADAWTTTKDVVAEVLDTFGCPACSDLGPNGTAIMRLNDGQPIVKPWVDVTVIISSYDELVTPTSTAFIDEPGVKNLYVQQYCPQDPVGHIGEAYDTNVWNLVINALQATPNRQFNCSIGSPGK